MCAKNYISLYFFINSITPAQHFRAIHPPLHTKKTQQHNNPKLKSKVIALKV